MKERGYLLLPGVIIVISFVVVAFFIHGRLAKSAGGIGGRATSQIQYHKEFVFRSKFSQLVEKVALARQLSQAEWPGKHPYAFKSVLFSDSMINHIWYASTTKGKIAFASESRPSATSSSIMQSPQVREKVLKALLHQDTYSEVVIRRDSVRWIYGTKISTPQAETSFLLGFELNMHEVQKYMEEADEEGHAYAFITDKRGVSIFNPDARLIGKKVLTASELLAARSVLPGKSVLDTVESDFLKLPVVRRYSSFRTGGQDWIFVVDTPTLLVDDEIFAISRDSLLLGLFALVVILATGAYSQRKWLNEFGLRRRAEEEQQTLLLEKQQLLLNAEKQQKENVLLQLDKLKEKINPHFLFNSLGSLSALIGKEPDTAKAFVLGLSRVYRYVLNGRPDSLSSFEEEIAFAGQYIFLLKVRFGEALQFRHGEIEKEYLQKRLPFMSIQTAIENAVKHNVVSLERPLVISVERKGEQVRVSNTLQLRSALPEPGGHGLYYIESIYNYYGVPGFRHGAGSDVYECYFPFI